MAPRRRWWAVVAAALVGALLTHTAVLRMTTKAQSGKTMEGTDVREAVPDGQGVDWLPEDVHAFYYAWYGNPQTDGKYIHWNHVRMPHWDPKVAAAHSQAAHVPPEDIGASFYPALGPYSSKDAATVADHMAQLRLAHVGVIAVSWYAPSRADPNGQSPDPLVPMILDAAAAAGIRICWHLEPYEGRNAVSVRDDVQYIIATYGHHPAFLRMRFKIHGPALPVFYVYDSYLTPLSEWKKLLLPGGDASVRGTFSDGLFVGLAVTLDHITELASGGFDAVYTYFASHGFTPGSTLSNWQTMSTMVSKAGMAFIPSIGPGYDDVAVRPWNGGNSRDRSNGLYYRQSFMGAFRSRPTVISITSMNEWHEGTQIERAVHKTKPGAPSYLDYGFGGPDMYLTITAELVDQWREAKT